MGGNGSPVTRAELAAHIVSIDERLQRTPTRWEVRFLILAGFIASQLVPTGDIARAALALIP
jgi:hypothetical protein